MALNHEVIVTDVTCYGTLYCVAGWDVARARMIRPEPPGTNVNFPPSRFWANDVAGPGRIFAVGNVVHFDTDKPPEGSAWPHLTEDRLLRLESAHLVDQLAVDDVRTRVAPSVSPSIQAAFGGELIRAGTGTAYVPVGVKTGSLGAIEVSPQSIKLYENAEGNSPKLRGLVESDATTYDLSIPADAPRTRWKGAGLAALRKDIAGSAGLHIRLGLSRPFAAMPDRCYAQINGIYLL